MILRLTTLHENDAVISLLDKEGPGVVDCWATTPTPSSFGGGEPFSWQRGILPCFGTNRGRKNQSEIPRSARNDTSATVRVEYLAENCPQATDTLTIDC